MHRPLIFLLLFLLVFLPAEMQAAQRYALLVACSKYPNYPRQAPLPGTENDSRVYADLLRKHFGFDDIVTLAGWPDDPKRRPSRANIVRGFERLIEKAKAGSQIMIVLSGHGTQFDVPRTQVDLLDPQNPEPDGLDEVFLPADYANASDCLRDDQFGVWLRELKAKGSHVWIVFDCCFSGGMSRGSQEAARTVRAADVGVKNERAKAARESTIIGPATYAPTGKTPAAGVPSTANPTSGSVVAFYASQSFETAKEVNRPRGAEGAEHRHGLLSYHLAQALTQRATATTYAELARELTSRMRADMGHGGPTPSFEGDLDFEIFGLKQWPQPKPLVLEESGDVLRLTAGEIAGVTAGAILAVYAPDDKEQRRVLGYIEATEVTPTGAAVKSISMVPSQPATPLEAFPNLCHCRVISRELGNLAVTIAAEPVAASQLAALLELLREADFVNPLPDTKQADWVVTVASDATTRETQVLLRESESGKVYATYPLVSMESVASRLKEDLRRIFTWNNLWRIAHEYRENSTGGVGRKLALEVAKVRGPQDTSEGQLLQTSQLRSGDHVKARVVNHGYSGLGENMNFVVLFLGPHFEIELVRYGSIRGREIHESHPIKQPVDKMWIGPVDGKAGYVVIAAQMKDHPRALNYRFLQQDPVGVPSARQTTQIRGQLTAFEQLLLTASEGKPRLRSALDAPVRPDVSSWSWTIVSDQIAEPQDANVGETP